jgi:preprotein translocase subunit SecD
MVHIPKWQVVLVLALLLCGLALAAPNLVSRKAAENIPGWLPHKQISLGLDLRGGSYLLLEAQLESVEQEHFGNLADSLRRELRKAKIGTTDLRVGPKGVSFRTRRGRSSGSGSTRPACASRPFSARARSGS